MHLPDHGYRHTAILHNYSIDLKRHPALPNIHHPPCRHSCSQSSAASQPGNPHPGPWDQLSDHCSHHHCCKEGVSSPLAFKNSPNSFDRSDCPTKTLILFLVPLPSLTKMCLMQPCTVSAQGSTAVSTKTNGQRVSPHIRFLLINYTLARSRGVPWPGSD